MGAVLPAARAAFLVFCDRGMLSTFAVSFMHREKILLLSLVGKACSLLVSKVTSQARHRGLTKSKIRCEKVSLKKKKKKISTERKTHLADVEKNNQSCFSAPDFACILWFYNKTMQD